MTPPTPAPRARRWITSAIAIPLLAVIALISWGFSSPIGSSADDDFHLTSAWCGGLTAEDLCGPTGKPAERIVSPDLFRNAVCFHNQPAVSATCQGANLGDDLTEHREVSQRANFTGLYPPVYYFTMSLFAGDNLQISALSMRVFTSVLFVSLVTGLFFLLPLRRRHTLIVSILVTMVPLGIFYIPSNNPTGWALISAGTLWMALLGYFETTGVRRLALGGLALLSTVIGAGARADSAIYSGVAIVAVVALTATRTRAYLVSLALPAVLSIIALVAAISANQSAAVSTGLTGGPDRPVHALSALVLNNLVELPDLLLGSFGTWPLGWLDTKMPAVVALGAVVAFALALPMGQRSTNRRQTWVGLGVLALYIAVPMFILVQSNAYVGSEVQPRYILPLLILLTGIVLVQSRQGELRISRPRALMMVGILAIANAVALHTNIRRYVTGLDQGSGNLDSSIEWWWNMPVSPMTLWFIGSTSFGLLLLTLGRVWLKTQHQELRDEAISTKWDSISL